MKLKRGFTILLIFFFLATITMSLTFIAENFHHDCTGDDCVICQMLETAEEISGGGKAADMTAASAKLNFRDGESKVIAVDNHGAVASTPVILRDLLTI